ncbi:radical SAM protein [Cesiribacter andamanensis]|uniref:Molybdenum cofactor biosynthesis protein A n=1 Tax=Cesiribacter andamanensis AMV16 TaxID=1279009 RepID=M7NZU5_9BACT|nr:radical SAM protein [Cesiribacter andamanensis]EMR03879.1 Molybdenum cofactor biosynthesis protein A [Cesiribacter andamanensis AMV16]
MQSFSYHTAENSSAESEQSTAFRLRRTGKPHPQVVSDPAQLRQIHLRLRYHIWKLALQQMANPFKAYAAIQKGLGLQLASGSAAGKIARIGNSFQASLLSPSWPSAAFDAYVRAQLQAGRSCSSATAPAVASLSVTQHCSPFCQPRPGGQAQPDPSLDSLKKQIQKLQKEGVRQIELCGGEPMLRYADLLELLQTAAAGTDFWLSTSGWELSPERALALKAAGLRGVRLNLDHNDPDKHNALRGYKHSYGWVMRAAESARTAGLGLCLNLCVTPDFVSDENLMAYARLAAQLGASFIQILAPRATAAGYDHELELSPEQISELNTFAHRLNHTAAYASWPLVAYQGWVPQKAVSAASGNRVLLMDAQGNLRACRHCQSYDRPYVKDRSPLRKTAWAPAGTTQSQPHP